MKQILKNRITTKLNITAVLNYMERTAANMLIRLGIMKNNNL